MVTTRPPRRFSVSRLLRSRRGSVAVLTALMAPLFIGTAGLGVEASYWMVLTTDLQRTADTAALAATISYNNNGNSSLYTQVAANAGADLAELNGITGSVTRVWTGGTNTLQDGSMIMVKLISGIKTSSDNAFQVTVQQTVPLALTRLFLSGSTTTITATAIAELIQHAPTTSQPCVTAFGDGNTADNAITLTGAATINATNCSVRSNGSISLSGSTNITAQGTYAGGTINIPQYNPSTVSGGSYQHAGTIADAYSNYTTLQNALAQLGSGGNADPNVGSNSTVTINPGTYASITVGGAGTLIMNPGLYVVNGDVTVGGSGDVGTAVLHGNTGVSIVSSGSLLLNGSADFNVAAADSTTTSGAVPGVVYASTGTTAAGKSVTITGSASTATMAGLIYMPHGNINLSGAVNVGSSGCLEYASATMTISGSASLGGNCSSYGLPSFSALPANWTVSLVQ